MVLSFTVAQEASSAPKPSAADESASTSPRRELLVVAWQGTIGMPDVPHIRNRTRLQESIALRAIESGEIELAAAWAPRIANWRRGVVLAELGLQLARAGKSEEALAYVKKAEAEVAAIIAEPESQAWYSDRIRVRLAIAYHTLGQRDMAARCATGLVDSEAGEWVRLVATEGAEKHLDQQLTRFDDIFAKGDLDQVVNGCTTCIEFYDRYFDQPERRERIERQVQAAIGRLAPTPAILQLIALAAAAAKHDPAHARALAADVDARLHAIRWQPGDDIGLRARLAGVLAVAGDEAGAVVQLDQMVTDYGHQREAIESMNRADVLVPIAEAYLRAGAEAQAEATYRNALQESLVNPNSRPRLEDIVGIVLSLTRADAEPTASLLAEVRTAARGLGNPW